MERYNNWQGKLSLNGQERMKHLIQTTKDNKVRYTDRKKTFIGYCCNENQMRKVQNRLSIS